MMIYDDDNVDVDDGKRFRMVGREELREEVGFRYIVNGLFVRDIS